MVTAAWASHRVASSGVSHQKKEIVTYKSLVSKPREVKRGVTQGYKGDSVWLKKVVGISHVVTPWFIAETIEVIISIKKVIQNLLFI